MSLAALARQRLLVTPYVHRMAREYGDLANVGVDAKRRRQYRARYEGRIEALAEAIAAAIGVDQILVERAGIGAANSAIDKRRMDPDTFEVRFWNELGDVTLAPMEGRVLANYALRRIGLAFAHAYDQEVNVWKVQARTHVEESFTAPIEIWLEVLDNVIRFGASSIRRYVERCLGETKPAFGPRTKAEFWADYEAMFWRLVG